MVRLSIFFSVVILIISACKQDRTAEYKTAVSNQNCCNYFELPDSLSKNANVRMITIDGKYKVWTKQFGNGPIKVLLLHGGPAMTHEYMECFESFFPKAGIEFFEYDQLGSYYSDQPDDSSLWTTERFVEEVEQVRKALGLDNTNFYLLGNSWGGILAMEYALKYQNNLKGLIVSNMTASIPRYEQYNTTLRSQMRKPLLDSLESFERKGDVNNPAYTSLVETNYYNEHICRIVPWPDPVQRSFKHVNSVIYVMMQGPSEFKTGGRLLHWDRWNDLKNIHVPTLMIGGKYDTMNPADMEAQSKLVQHGRYLYCPNGSHLSMWDDQEHYYPGIIQFLNDVQSGNFK
ncbi:MAG: proline iminopeptidase-family hydrolase [Chitinophagales bacterium]|nr:proline iminopeptidase-family hydrolase [Chitinophagales bacterium]